MVIYVVNHRQPGQTQGDWAVKTEGGRIISKHRLKKRAMKKARREARKRDCGLRVQASNGKFQKH